MILKKIISSFLAVAMVAAMSTTVFAKDESVDESKKNTLVTYNLETGERTEKVIPQTRGAAITSTEPSMGTGEMGELMHDDIDESKKNTLVTYNLETGERTEKVIPQTRGAAITSIAPSTGTGEMGELMQDEADPTDANQEVTPYGFDSNWSQVTSTSSFPYRAIAQLSINYPSGTQKGTGFMVDPGKIFTAAHCLKNLNGEVPTSITAYFGRNGSSWYTSTTAYASSFTVNGMWDSYQNADYDYGIISVPTSISDSTGYFGMRASVDTSTNYNLTGYPNSGIHFGASKMRIDSGRLTSVGTTTSFDHPFNSCGGMSGSPLYSNDNYAVGIHTWGPPDEFVGGTATAVTSDVINLVLYS